MRNSLIKNIDRANEEPIRRDPILCECVRGGRDTGKRAAEGFVLHMHLYDLRRNIVPVELLVEMNE